MSLSSLFPARRIEEMREHVRRFASRFGITDLRVSDHVPSTRKALSLAEHARDRGRLEEFRAAVMSGLWREGLDIESDEDLRLLLARAGLDPAEAMDAATDPRYLERLKRAAREAHQMEVTGVPTFFFGTDEVIVGCQPYDSLARAAEAAGARRRSDQTQ